MNIGDQVMLNTLSPLPDDLHRIGYITSIYEEHAVVEWEDGEVSGHNLYELNPVRTESGCAASLALIAVFAIASLLVASLGTLLW